MNVQSFRDLLVWQHSVDLMAEICSTTRALPFDEKFHVIEQLRYSAIAIPLNIAESVNAINAITTQHFLTLAQDSLHTLEVCLILANQQMYLANEQFQRFWNMSQAIKHLLLIFSSSPTNPS